MAHFAEIDTDSIVLRVLVVPDEEEHRGQEFLADDLGLGGTWIQTSYNTRANVHYGPDGEPDGGVALHYNYAALGGTWDGTGFADPAPFPSWLLDDTYTWQPPTPYPDDGKDYRWDEDTTSWVEVTE